MSGSKHVINFGAGPAKIPQPVLLKAQKEFLNVNGTGMSVMELSHRSKPFGTILEKTKQDLTKLMNIPSNYSILFMQGGATTEFASIFYNIIAAKQQELKQQGREGEEIVVDYLVTGAWSNKAAQEAERLVPTIVDNPVRVNRALDVKKTNGKFGIIPPQTEWKLTDPRKHNVAYVYYCDNETVHGVEFQVTPDVDPSVPLVADVSSNFLSRPIDVAKYGIIYGGAQKNLGPAGVTILVVRNDLLIDLNVGPVRPLMLDFKTAADNNSMYNTPPTFAIYIVGLTLEWLLEKGGLDEVEKVNQRKAEKLYLTIDQSSLYDCPVEPHCRSHMNVVFRLSTEDLEKEFLKGAEERNMQQLKGHRSVGGIRASIYNALSEEDVDALIDYMNEFEKNHKV
ncbi:MAG: phosphoserine aminotransferase [Benjaminiella poitrasii]|nr:MAG: phosphoserine aminotransferase [Benjaminiella poitrasii]